MVMKERWRPAKELNLAEKKWYPKRVFVSKVGDTWAHLNTNMKEPVEGNAWEYSSKQGFEKVNEWDPGHNSSVIREGTPFFYNCMKGKSMDVNANKFLGSIARCLVRIMLDSIFYKMEEANHWWAWEVRDLRRIKNRRAI